MSSGSAASAASEDESIPPALDTRDPETSARGQSEKPRVRSRGCFRPSGREFIIRAMTLVERITQDLTTAMKAKDVTRTSVLRMAKAALKNREIDKGEPLDDPEVVKALQSLVKQREDSAEQYAKGGRPELAEKERAEIVVLKEYLPAEVSDEEIAAVIDKVIQETGASSPKDMGKVMKAAMAALAESGKTVDGKRVNAAARKKLGG
jgi:uncharacterized protein YqeY